MNEKNISQGDKSILRELAKRQMEIANSEQMKEKVKQWYLHNDLKGSKPMFTIEVGTFYSEIEKPLICESECGRSIEATFNAVMANYDFIGDDKPVPPFFALSYSNWFKPFDIEIKREFASKGALGHHFVEEITDLEDDFHKLKPSTFGSEGKAALLERKAFLEEIFGDILPVELCGNSQGCCLTQDVVHLMSMETMLYSMYDYPELFHKMMDNLANDYISYFQWLEQQDLLLSTSSFGWLGQGTLCFTNDLPSSGKIKLSDSWIYMDSQESAGISPDMYGEFVFPYIKKVSDKFGLFSYGCCEAVHPIFKDYISKCENLRKVSVSPWCDESIIGSELKGKNTIFLRKPSPNFLGVGRVFDEDGWRGSITDTIKAANGCKLEFSQRDVYTLSGDISKLKRATAIAREAIENHWQS